MIINTYFDLAIILFILAFFIIRMQMNYLLKHREKYDPEYDGHKLFLDFYFRKLKYFLRILNIYLKLFYQKILHYRVQILSWLTSLSERVYMKSRDEFVKEVVKDKKGVPHFWSHLKRYKKEMDEETKNRIDDDSMSIIKK